MAEVALTPRARVDLEDIWLYIATDSVTAADRLIDRIVERIGALADYPELGPARRDIASDARMLTVGDHLILYRKSHAGVEIVRVTHGARRLKAIWPGADGDSG